VALGAAGRDRPGHRPADRLGGQPLPWTYPPITNIAGLLYTIPSLALFIIMPSLIQTKILSPINVVVALTVYTVACWSGGRRRPELGAAGRPRPPPPRWASRGRPVLRVELPFAVRCSPRGSGWPPCRT
jgi:hypothetical protein